MTIHAFNLVTDTVQMFNNVGYTGFMHLFMCLMEGIQATR